jgi:hypothetical protein
MYRSHLGKFLGLKSQVHFFYTLIGMLHLRGAWICCRICYHLNLVGGGIGLKKLMHEVWFVSFVRERILLTAWYIHTEMACPLPHSTRIRLCFMWEGSQSWKVVALQRVPHSHDPSLRFSFVWGEVWERTDWTDALTLLIYLIQFATSLAHSRTTYSVVLSSSFLIRIIGDYSPKSSLEPISPSLATFSVEKRIQSGNCVIHPGPLLSIST